MDYPAIDTTIALEFLTMARRLNGQSGAGVCFKSEDKGYLLTHSKSEQGLGDYFSVYNANGTALKEELYYGQFHDDEKAAGELMTLVNGDVNTHRYELVADRIQEMVRPIKEID